MARVLITGISGQDGAFLARQLLARGDEVWGTYRRGAERTFSRPTALGIHDQLRYALVDMAEAGNLIRTLDRTQPDAIYHLAAQSFVGDSFEQPTYTFDVNATGTARLLDAARTVVPRARVYQASTSEMFGDVKGEAVLDEDGAFRPRSPYAISKLAAHHLVGVHRDAYGLFGCRGILFNHESELRGTEFVTRKITRAVGAVARGEPGVLALGNLDARRDWGYAPEYVDAMVRMMSQDAPDDYVIATGRAASVREFATLAFAAIDVTLVWSGAGVDEVARDAATGALRVRVDPTFWRPAEVGWLRGDASKASRQLGWTATTALESLVRRMVDHDVRTPTAPALSP